MFLDIGVGILLSVWTSWHFQTDFTFFLILFGIIFALLPDIDFFIELVKHGSVGGKTIKEHRQLTHYPIAYIPVALFIYFLFGVEWAFLFFGAALFHFIHDSIGIGWGIKWFWPFSKRTYKLFSDKNGKFFLGGVSWDDKELKIAVEAHGDPNWIKNVYFRPSLTLIIESMGLLISLIILYLYL